VLRAPANAAILVVIKTHTRNYVLQKFEEKPTNGKAFWSAIEREPNFFGFGVNLKKVG
jgi:hypothetical protein